MVSKKPAESNVAAAVAGAKVKVKAKAKPVAPEAAALVRRFYEEGWSRGDLGVLEEIAPEAAECQKELRRLRKAFPDLRIEIESLEQDGDDVVVRWIAHGTHQGAIEALKATGRRGRVPGTTRIRVADGRLTRIDASWDQAELRKQFAP